MDVEQAVRDRYAAAASQREEALCCPIDYDARYLEAIPQEVLERDYGCGDPSRYVRAGDTVLDLGSGGGKICFIAAQIAGPEGRVIGVDINDEMLELAQRAAPRVGATLGYSNVEFRRGHIEDLKPIVDDASVDLVVSNCVLNLVREESKRQLIGEIYRVLRRGGRIAISDIVSNQPVPADLKADPELWSGCVSGAFLEADLLGELERAGFLGVSVDKREEKPFAIVGGIEFHSITVTAYREVALGAPADGSGCCPPQGSCGSGA